LKTILLSHFVGKSTPQFGGKDEIKSDPTRSMRDGDTCNSLSLSFPNHISTHVDAPFHFAPEFWVLDDFALLEIPTTAPDLVDFDVAALLPSKKLSGIQALFIRTGFEKFRETDRYWSENPGLAPALGAKLRAACPQLRFVGMDFISATSYRHREEGRKAHFEFLSREILFIEDMKLSAWSDAPRSVVVSPLMLEGADGAPSTVFGMYG
jgi:arylformamidase